MAIETERKFLVKGEFKKYAVRLTSIIQGYISSNPERTVRIRIHDGKGFITIKGAGNESGASRYEWEKEITYSEALDLIKLCEPGVIEKTRYYIPSGEFTFEVDEFSGENEGLIIAEVELKSESDIFDKPDWLGSEITGDQRYYNSSLVKNPFTRWAPNIKNT